jgi:hypothetical protein
LAAPHPVRFWLAVIGTTGSFRHGNACLAFGHARRAASLYHGLEVGCMRNRSGHTPYP